MKIKILTAAVVAVFVVMTTAGAQSKKLPLTQALHNKDPLAKALKKQAFVDFLDGNIMNDDGVQVEARQIVKHHGVLTAPLVVLAKSELRKHMLKTYRNDKRAIASIKKAKQVMSQAYLFDYSLPHRAAFMKIIASHGFDFDTSNRKNFVPIRRALRIPLKAMGATHTNTVVIVTQTHVWDSSVGGKIPYFGIFFVNRLNRKMLRIWVRSGL